MYIIVQYILNLHFWIYTFPEKKNQLLPKKVPAYAPAMYD